tara:strand:- start:719 stop:1474 length:756 start_codon:yes stop_codon:yes gene_type:complete
MVKQPDIDIIIPNYNKAKYLNQCLDSILSQTYKNWKIYLVDDNSHDDSAKIFKKYENIDNINFFLLKENKGPAFCRNYAIDKSSSEFIAFMDSDDFWPKDKLKKQINEMLKNDYNFTYTDYNFFFNDNEEKIKTVKMPLFLDYKNFILKSSMSTSSIIISRNSLGNVKFKNVDQEDYLFKCDLLKKGETAFNSKDTFVYYRINKNNRSANKLKNLVSLWQINKIHNQLNFFTNLKSLFFISINSLKKYGWK